MKTIKIFMALLAGAIIVTACDPIEDQELRDKYVKGAGSPIAKETLQAAISVTQPIPNEEGKVEGDQYVVLKNSRPDIGGTWHIEWISNGNVQSKIYGTDNDTIIMESNNEFSIYYTGISANQMVKTDPVKITVTNVFDEWDGFLTGAKDKSDKAATKTWKFREDKWGLVCFMGAYGYWKYYEPEISHGNAWWGQTTLAQAGDQKMIFEYDENKMTTYSASGTVKNAGGFSYSHNIPDEKVLGELTTTVPLIGSEFDDNGQNKTSNKFWVLTLTDEYMTLFHPGKYTGGTDWNDDGYCVMFKSIGE